MDDSSCPTSEVSSKNSSFCQSLSEKESALCSVKEIDLEAGIVSQTKTSPNPFAQKNESRILHDVDYVGFHEVPQRIGPRAFQKLNWFFLSTYRKIFSWVFLANVGVLVGLLAKPALKESTFTENSTITATAVNILVALVARQEHVINLLFWLSCRLPLSAPLWIRRRMAKIYSYGGVHSGCGIASIAWYLGYTALLAQKLARGSPVHPLMITITIAIDVLLLLIVILAYPKLRQVMHNWFERTHRFAGWTVVILFWVQVVLNAALTRSEHSIGFALVRAPAFWCLCGISLIVLYPWVRLRSRTIIPEYLSGHAVRLHFNYGYTSYCQAIRISDSPLSETHSFAAIAEPNKKRGFSVVVSKAGDWTSRIIASQPQRIWVRGTPTTGMLYVATAFRRCVTVATGSGIGPCLSLFRGRPDILCRVLWSTPSPLQTYGANVVDDVLQADPEACIVDTRKAGRPDLLALAYHMYRIFEAEAVLVISNKTVTKSLVYDLESRGIPAYGPIFDS